jgi:hypothetical protein
MAYTTINKSTDNFTTHLYSGNDSTNNQTSLGMTPDLVWVKCRNHATPSHYIVDKVRGDKKYISSNATTAEQTDSNTFDLVSGGFNLAGGNGWTNVSGRNYASWNWKAGGGQGSSNTDGTINTTYTSVNSTAKFSISQYTGTGSNATFGHGLGVAPTFYIIKETNSTGPWFVGHVPYTGDTGYVYLQSTGVGAASGQAFTTAKPTASLINLGTDVDVNQSGQTYIAYCFAEVAGFSKFGKYIGNGNATTPTFIYTGFKPKFVIVKNVSQSDSWFMHDDKRDGFNDDNEYLFTDLTNAEGTNVNRISLYSNGFNVPTTDKSHNVNGNNYIYMAFGQSIVGSNNIPATAR